MVVQRVGAMGERLLKKHLKGRGGEQKKESRASVWMMSSAGPDKVDDTSNNSGFKLTEGHFPWPSLPDNDSAVKAILGLSYDASNGPRRGGNVYRVGGVKPHGRPYSALFSGSVSQ